MRRVRLTPTKTLLGSHFEALTQYLYLNFEPGILHLSAVYVQLKKLIKYTAAYVVPIKMDQFYYQKLRENKIGSAEGSWRWKHHLQNSADCNA